MNRFFLGLLRLSFASACLAAANACSADTAIIAEQDFNALSSSATATTDSLSSGSPLSNAGAYNAGGPGLDFAAYWFDTRGGGSGPVTPSGDSSDSIGVNSFAGSGAPNASPEGFAVVSGAEHNFAFSDTDGRIDLVFEPVDLSAFAERALSFDYWIADTGYEAGDAFYVTLSDGASSRVYLDFGDAELESNASPDDGAANWKSLSIDLEELFDYGFGAILTVTIGVNTNSSAESVYIDNLRFRGGETETGAGAEPVAVTIPQIQGAGHLSPYDGARVRTTGIVTAVDSNAFYVQDAQGDGDIATSDAIAVFTVAPPPVTVGDEVQIVGSVDELFVGDVTAGDLSRTEIVSPQIAILSSDNALPAPVLLGAGGRAPPTENIDDDAFASFDPETDGLDFFESLESMRVTAQDLVAVGGTSRFGEIFAVLDGGAGATGLSASGTLNIGPGDFNPERVQVDPDLDLLPDFYAPWIDVGAALGDVTGILRYSFGNFEIAPTEPFAATPSPLVPGVSALRSDGDTLLVATYNAYNLDPNELDGDTDLLDGRFDAIAAQIVDSLGAPDVIALQEIQDNSGSANDGVVSASLTLQTLVDAISGAGGPGYAFIDHPFIGDDTNGGQPGANIRVAFLYNPQRVSLVAGSLRAIAADGQQTDPGNPFFDSRPPLVAQFRFNEQTILFANCHFSSKSGSAPIFGIEQPFEALQDDPMVNGAVDFRRAQAMAVKQFVDAELARDPDARLVVLGDFNEFEFVSPLYEVLGSSLTNLIFDLPDNERYSYLFEGNSQSIDHIFASEKLLDEAELQIVHVNAEFAHSYARASDHDPVVATFQIQRPAPPPSPREIFQEKLNAFLDRLAQRSKGLSQILGSLLKLFGFGR